MIDAPLRVPALLQLSLPALQPRSLVPRGGELQDGAASYARINQEAGRWPALISSSAAALVAATARSRRRGQDKALVQRLAGYDDEYWNFPDEDGPRKERNPSKGSGGGSSGSRQRREDGWKRRSEERPSGVDHMRRMDFRKEGRRGKRWTRASVVDQTEEMNAQASTLESMYKRPGSKGKGKGKGKGAPPQLSANMPAIGTGEVWLSKFLSHAGVASRRRATELVLQGRVKVNGEVVQAVAMKVDPEKDVVTVDGDVKRLQTLGEIVWVMMNKPKGYLCDRKDPRGRRTIMDIVPFAKKRRLVPVGRMDKQASGIMLLTNDLEWHTIFTHKRYGCGKAYKVVVYGGQPSEEKLQALREGLQLPDQARPLLPVEDIEIVRNADASLSEEVATLTFTLYDNSYRVVRRMFEYLGHQVKSQKRIGFGPLRLKNLKPGHFVQLSAKEIKQLKDHVTNQSKAPQYPVDEVQPEDSYVEEGEEELEEYEDEYMQDELEDEFREGTDPPWLDPSPPWLARKGDFKVDAVTQRVQSEFSEKAPR